MPTQYSIPLCMFSMKMRWEKWDRENKMFVCDSIRLFSCIERRQKQRERKRNMENIINSDGEAWAFLKSNKIQLPTHTNTIQNNNIEYWWRIGEKQIDVEIVFF